MATIRLTVLNSIKESNRKLPILICISQKKERSSHISFIEYWKKRIADFRKDGRESYAKIGILLGSYFTHFFMQYTFIIWVVVAISLV